MRHGAESITEELFPRTLQMDGATFPLAYRFEPGHPLDGVTINVPLALLNQVDDAAIDWLVPGMVRDKVAWTMKALPKRIRSQLVPVPEHVTSFLSSPAPPLSGSSRTPPLSGSSRTPPLSGSSRTPQRGNDPGSSPI
jgi:ATP-dependent helicase HrpA